ncbi:MAG: metallophosphoesterase [Polyangiaceae bacterium]|nr:metallophosphoesterase [Polyangiaceae bacterium]
MQTTFIIAATLAFVALDVRSALAQEPKAARIVKGPWLQGVTTSSAEIRVEVDPPAAVEVRLAAKGTDDAGATGSVHRDGPRALHRVPITGLEPAKAYEFTVKVPGATSASVTGSFVTAPKEESSAKFRFIAYGDNRTDHTAHAAVVHAITSRPFDFLVHTGDFVENGASKSDWQTFFDIEAPLLKAKFFASCVGNHELTDGAGVEYARYFGPKENATLDELVSTFRWGNTRFFLINGMVSYKSGPARSWLESALDHADHESGLVWRIVVVHHGPWSSGPHGGNMHFAEAKIPALLTAHGVDLVFAGHDHIYERGFHDGLPYVITGGGGAPLYRVKYQLPFSRKVESTHHFVEAEVDPQTIVLTAVRPDGSTIERCPLVKAGNGARWTCDDPDGGSATSVSSSRAEQTPPSPEGSLPQAPAAPSSRCSCRVAGAAPSSSVQSALVLAMILGATFVARRMYSSREYM